VQVFTSITPAWSNENLSRLSTKLESGVIFAHVRAAYPGMPGVASALLQLSSHLKPAAVVPVSLIRPFLLKSL
jgi:hypothetical protein